MQIRRLSYALGAEISGVDIRNPLDDKTFKEIHAAFLKYSVLLFRGTPLTREQHIAFSRMFGEIRKLPEVQHKHNDPKYPELLLLTNQFNARSPGYTANEIWHTDKSSTLVPPMASLLRCVEIPHVGGDTMFTNCYLAYETLTDAMKRMLDGLHGIHVGGGNVIDDSSPERLAEFPNIDGVAAFTHATGCGMELAGEPMDLLRRTLSGYIRHPNMAAVLVVGLGCERNQINTLFQAEKLTAGTKLKTFVMQDSGGTRKTIEAGIEAIRELLPEANKVTRVPVDASHITVGLQCGGSDSFSSITANPALGVAMDILVQHGGTAILSETPEIYGVEHTLTRRAVTKEVGEKLIERIRWWKDEYAIGRDVQINGVVSPGNQAGGLANILEKSLGSAMKGGSTGLMEVYKYAELVKQRGLVFMDTPGFDPVSATGQIAGGANVVCFTTGRGSAFGCKPAPSIKLATNTPMFTKLEEDMDINCGEILDGTADMQQMGQKIFQLILDTCSGKETKSEAFGLGDHEFIPWAIGITG